MDRYKKSNGFSVAEMLVALCIMAIFAAATTALISAPQKLKNIESNTLKCVASQHAVDLDSPACLKSVEYCKFNKMDACKALIRLADSGSATNKPAARKVLRQVCDAGGEKACEYMVTSCMKDNSMCDETGTFNDFNYYLTLARSDSNLGRMRVRDLAKAYITLGNKNISNAVSSNCCPTVNTACEVLGITDCREMKLQYGGAGDDAARGMTTDGSFIYVTGYESSDNATGLGGGKDLFVMEINPFTGIAVIKTQYGGAGDEEGYAIVNDRSNLYVTGYESSDTSGGGSSKDIILLKLDLSTGGTVIFRNQYGGAGDDVGKAMIIERGNIYITGYESSDTRGGGKDIVVMKLDSSDGHVLWQNQYGGVNDDEGSALVSDGTNIYVTGYESSADGGGGKDIVVLKLDPATGSVIWKNQYGGTGDDEGNSIAISGTNLYVTGYESSDPNGGGKDIFIMKLDSSDGHVLWRNQFGGANDDIGYGITTDASNLYVTGSESSDSAGGNTDIVVMKLDPSDGHAVWRKQYGGSNNDEGFGISLIGNYLGVVGYESSDSNGGGNDIVVMKLNKNQSASNITAGTDAWTLPGDSPLVNEPIAAGASGWTLEGTTLNTEHITTGWMADSDETILTGSGPGVWMTTIAISSGTGTGVWTLPGESYPLNYEIILSGTNHWTLPGDSPLGSEIIKDWTVGL